MAEDAAEKLHNLAFVACRACSIAGNLKPRVYISARNISQNLSNSASCSVLVDDVQVGGGLLLEPTDAAVCVEPTEELVMVEHFSLKNKLHP